MALRARYLMLCVPVPARPFACCPCGVAYACVARCVLVVGSGFQPFASGLCLVVVVVDGVFAVSMVVDVELSGGRVLRGGTGGGGGGFFGGCLSCCCVLRGLGRFGLCGCGSCSCGCGSGFAFGLGGGTGAMASKSTAEACLAAVASLLTLLVDRGDVGGSSA